MWLYNNWKIMNKIPKEVSETILEALRDWHSQWMDASENYKLNQLKAMHRRYREAVRFTMKYSKNKKKYGDWKNRDWKLQGKDRTFCPVTRHGGE